MSQYDSTPPPPPPPPPPGSGTPGSGTPSSPYGGPQTGLSGRGTRFFDWMRGLGLVRTDGWIGGVCAAIANRLGIDPIIVRGIVVVAAIFGAPALLLYAAAWALLPDGEGRIHLQRLLDGDFQPAIAGIGAMVLLSLVPMAQGLWWAGGGFWGAPSVGETVGRVATTLVVLGILIALVVAATRGGNRNGHRGWGSPASTAGTSSAWVPTPAAAAPTPAATPSAPAANGNAPTVPMPASTSADSGADPAATVPLGAVPLETVPAAAAPLAPALDTSAEPSEPPAPTEGTSSQDYVDWQTRHTAWQAEHAQWKQRLNADMRAVKAQRSAELRAHSAALGAQAAAERRARRAANPRIGAAVGWAVVGLALVGAALTQALWSTTQLPAYGLTAAFAVATAIFGVAVLIAGLAKRRSGFLIFLGILLAIVTAASAFIPRNHQVLFDGASPTGPANTSIGMMLDPAVPVHHPDQNQGAGQ